MKNYCCLENLIRLFMVKELPDLPSYSMLSASSFNVSFYTISLIHDLFFLKCRLFRPFIKEASSNKQKMYIKHLNLTGFAHTLLQQAVLTVRGITTPSLGNPFYGCHYREAYSENLSNRCLPMHNSNVKNLHF